MSSDTGCKIFEVNDDTKPASIDRRIGSACAFREGHVSITLGTCGFQASRIMDRGEARAFARAILDACDHYADDE
jgi:hypothetical protein